MPINVIFALTYALLAQKRSLPVSLAGAYAVWLALTWLGGAVAWTLAVGGRSECRHDRIFVLAVGAVASRADAARAAALV